MIRNSDARFVQEHLIAVETYGHICSRTRGNIRIFVNDVERDL